MSNSNQEESKSPKDPPKPSDRLETLSTCLSSGSKLDGKLPFNLMPKQTQTKTDQEDLDKQNKKTSSKENPETNPLLLNHANSFHHQLQSVSFNQSTSSLSSSLSSSISSPLPSSSSSSSVKSNLKSNTIVHLINVNQMLDALPLPETKSSSTLFLNKTTTATPDTSTTPVNKSFESKLTKPLLRTSSVCVPGSLSSRIVNSKASSFQLPVQCKHFDQLKSLDLSSVDFHSEEEFSSHSSDVSIQMDLNQIDSTSNDNLQSKDSQRRQSRSLTHPPMCRICLNSSTNLQSARLLSPCNCRGPFSFAHDTCLAQWIRSTQTDTCDVCRFVFLIRRRPLRWTQYVQCPSFQKRLLSFTCFSLVLWIVLFASRLLTHLLSSLQTSLIRKAIRIYLLISCQFWTFVYAFIVIICVFAQTADFVRWRQQHFDIELQQNPNNLLRDHGVPPRNFIRASGLNIFS